MAPRTFNITDGPNKPALQRALMLPDEVTAHLQVEGEGVDVNITMMESNRTASASSWKVVSHRGQ